MLWKKTNKIKQLLIQTIYKKKLETDKIKTTNINILLNRVRLDKKRTFKKKVIFSILLVSIVSSLSIYLIIW